MELEEPENCFLGVWNNVSLLDLYNMLISICTAHGKASLPRADKVPTHLVFLLMSVILAMYLLPFDDYTVNLQALPTLPHTFPIFCFSRALHSLPLGLIPT